MDQIVEEPSTKAMSKLKIFEAYCDSKEKKYEIFRNDTLTFNDSPRQDAIVMSNIEEVSNPDVTVNATNMDTNINYGEPIITSLPEMTVVTTPKILFPRLV
ncbi:unnamed protein product [Lactuca saligna]|uniref:Uncharacterized protein n=1 Tax=Lactuca saligna TaxID=75948 RepID=A0AA36E2N0_LACSI|nr:unnamed protein product [Lactuca saligna]